MPDFIKVPLNLPELRVIHQACGAPNQLRVQVESVHSAVRCPGCQRATSADARDDRWRIVQDLDALGQRVFLRLRQRRFSCPHCRRRFLERFDCVGEKQRQTHRLQAQLVQHSRSQPLLQAARAAPVSYRTLSYLCFKVGEARAAHEQSRTLPRRIGVDEFATRKGHRYATVLTALTRPAVCGLAPERTTAALENLLSAPGRRPARVREAVIDMWQPFYQALRVCCRRARIVVDRFHAERHLWQAVDGCRKRLSRKGQPHAKALKAARRLFLTPAGKLRPEQRGEREQLLSVVPELARCVRLVERLHRWYSVRKDRHHADWQLSYWLRQLEQSGLPELTEVAALFRRWRQEIVNYFGSYSTNGVTEGFNTKIKLLKRTGYGRLTFEHLRARIFLECGRAP